MNVPYFRPAIGEAEIEEVAACLRSGWLTTGPVTKRFEAAFADAVGGKHAVAVNSCTAALHLAVEALGLGPGQAVLVPTMTFAATAEIVRYASAIPILIDCDAATQNMDLADAQRKLDELAAGRLPNVPKDAKPVGILPVHVGGCMVDLAQLRSFAERHRLWVVEDAAHAFPAAWRGGGDGSWQRCGEGTSAVSCFSFYANKTITTGEGGMAVTDDPALADRMRMMSLHGLSHDAWGRYSGGASWDYRILAPGYKYNLTDVASAMGIHQLARAEAMRGEREQIAAAYGEALSDVAELETPPQIPNRVHSWHLFPVRLRLERLSIDRNQFMARLKQQGVGCSVHWRPLHLHPYYGETHGWPAELFPIANGLWQRLISLPIFPGMTTAEREHVVRTVQSLCRENRR